MGENLYRELLKGSIEGVYILDAAGIIRTANQAMADLFGYEHPGELVGQPGTVLVAPRDREHLVRYYRARLRGDHAPRRHTCEAVGKDGSPRWIESLVSIITWEGAAAVLVTVLDVTQRRRLEQAEQEAAALRSLAQLACATAHEINNPLAIIMGNCELLAREVEPGSQPRVETMLAAVERIRSIVLQMPHIARMESAGPSATPHPVPELRTPGGEGGDQSRPPGSRALMATSSGTARTAPLP